ncbi:hypothetical protein ILUMI_27278 [Ignelater luminosus]|uniref:TROVE domain-containing protein n=1 Tax=Ignelater luminosus TaxID=2038154 RepID=A0A8K0C6U6_IGNLU|nr:hypothetical protein ILUMI_27278 [Ignelater luminosus]
MDFELVNARICLKRFLYLGSEHPTMSMRKDIVEQSYQPDQIISIYNFVVENRFDEALEIIKAVYENGRTPSKNPIYFCLAMLACSKTSDYNKQRLYSFLSDILKFPDDLFCFIYFYSIQNKYFSSGIRNMITRYYLAKDLPTLVDEVARFKGFHSCTHKNLIRLAHVKTDCVLREVVFRYVMHGLQNVISIPNEYPESGYIIEHFTKFSALQHTNDEDLMVRLITELKCDQVQQIPPQFRNSKAVWIALIPMLDVSDLIVSLPKLLKLGFLKEGEPCLAKITEIFSNEAVIKDSNIHPVEVFIGLMDYLKYGKKKNVDVKLKEEHLLSISTPEVATALGEVMKVAMNQIKPINKRFLIGINLISDMLQPCFTNRNTSCLEIASFYLFILLKTEPYVTVIIFSERKVKPLAVDKESTYNDIFKMMKSMVNKKSLFLQKEIFNWATKNNQQFDVFMHFTLQGFVEKEDFAECVAEYRTKISPNAKLITFLLKKDNPAVAEAVPNAIDICGFKCQTDEHKEVKEVV